MNDKYTYSVCYKCDGRGYLRDWEDKSYQCEICNGKGEVKHKENDGVSDGVNVGVNVGVNNVGVN